MSDDYIEVWTESGRNARVERRTWETRVLPAAIRRHWNDTENLRRLVITAAENDMAKRVLKAAQHLYKIGPNREEATSDLAFVQVTAGRVDEAERTLQTYLKGHESTESILAGLAHVRLERGQVEAAMALLRQVLAMNPNHGHCLQLWVDLKAKREGEHARAEAYNEISAEPGSYLAQVWLGGVQIEYGRFDEALALYEHALQLGPDDGDIMSAISTVLGQSGHSREMLELLLPRYDPKKHGVGAGANLVRALYIRGRIDEGLQLLDRLYEEDVPPPYSERLDELADLLEHAPRDAPGG